MKKLIDHLDFYIHIQKIEHTSLTEETYNYIYECWMYEYRDTSFSIANSHSAKQWFSGKYHVRYLADQTTCMCIGSITIIKDFDKGPNPLDNSINYFSKIIVIIIIIKIKT